MGLKAQRVADVGGGFGEQAIRLARFGHEVTVLDIDPTMLNLVCTKLSQEAPDVRSRVSCVLGDAQQATSLLGSGFDAVCCHSVLMYESDLENLLYQLVRLTRTGGLISILSVNPDASAMRSGLQGRWRNTVASLQSDEDVDDTYLPTYRYGRQLVSRVLEEAGARVRQWYGVGVFTDHLTETIVVEDPAEVYLAEWLAGERDPYRSIARCFHLIAERESSSN
jgi:S-adenosylmethionine-dependent methyltransferase